MRRLWLIGSCVADQSNGRKDRNASTSTGPHLAPIEDPEFAEVITDDLAVDAGEGLHLTRDPQADARTKQRSEPGIRLEELGVDPKKKKKASEEEAEKNPAQDG